MPDFDPGRGKGPMRRPVRGQGEGPRYGPGGLPSEGLDPAPKPWPWAPWLAAVMCLGFLALQLWPAANLRHRADPERTTRAITADDAEDVAKLEALRREWDPSFVEGKAISSPVAPVDSMLKGATGGGTISELLRRRRDEVQVHIFLSTDESDLRPLVVVINSTICNSRNPERLVFHLIIPASESNIEFYKLKTFFPSISIDVFRGVFDFEGLSKHITYRNNSHTRQELISPYNFLPFYLPQLYEDIEMMIYLDSDVVVKGPIEELYFKDLKGYPVAAVEDCSQQFKIYFDFEQLNSIQAREGDSEGWLPKEPFNAEACIFNRGVLLINATRWKELKITDAIEWWMNEYHKAEKPLYRYGLSQPPFLLALYKNYEKLEHAWNTRGLGRNKLSKLEQEYLATRYKHKPDQHPFLSLESDFARILHFNGKFKPWKRSRVRLSTEEIVSLCGQDGQECHKLWWEYISLAADNAFKHYSG